MQEKSQKTGIIYCRVSSYEQVGGTSLESQERLCKEYAERNNIKVLKVFIEKGESAKTINRTEFKKALTLCNFKKNKVGYFIVYKVDRFARNQEDHVTIKIILKRCGTELRSVTEPIDDTPVGKAMEGVLSVFAEFDNNVRTERTKQGMLERVKKGIWAWKCPPGYYRPTGASNIEPDPNTAPYIRQAFERYAEGVHTYKAIAEYLTGLGFKTTLGCKLSAQWVEKVLKNPLYFGLIDMWGEKITGDFEPIISKELFDKCLMIGKKPLLGSPRSVNNPMFPLRKLIACKECGVPLTGSSSKGRKEKYAYYHHPRQGCAKAVSIPKATFEQEFIEYLQSITPSPRYEKLFKAVVIDIWQSNYKKFDDENTRIRLDIAKLEQERQRIFEFHRNGKYNDQEFLEQKNLINHRIDEKNSLIHEKRVEEFNMEEALDYCFKFVRQTAKTWKQLESNFTARMRFQKRIFAGRVEFDGQKFGTAALTNVYRINQEYQKQKSDLVAPSGFEPEFLR